jgi:dimethylaniline monooxygenase (N-oxide forming)
MASTSSCMIRMRDLEDFGRSTIPVRVVRNDGKASVAVGSSVIDERAPTPTTPFFVPPCFLPFVPSSNAFPSHTRSSVQSTAELYEYPCKRFPKAIRDRKDPPAPTAAEVCTYLEEYIDEKNMRSKFRFGKKIATILCNSETEWIIEFDDFSTRTFSFVIVCNGLVSVKPKVVNWPGTKAFLAEGGTMLHSSERRSDDIFVGKRVMVVGNGKSAADAAAAAANVAQENGTDPPIQLARRQTWYVPRYILGFLQYKWFFHTRLGSLLLPAYYETPLLYKIFHFLFAPLKWIVWRLVEVMLLCQFCLPYRLWPSPCTIEGATVENSVLITDESHLRRLRRGEVDMRIGTINHLQAGKAVMSDGKEVQVDVIVQATGWSLGFDTMIDEASLLSGLDFMYDGLDFCEDGLWLYRNILPASFNGIAFVGSNTLTFMNIFTSYVQAYWLAQLLAGDRPWPERKQMKETVEREKAFKRRYYRIGDMRGASVEAYMQHYHDILFREMNARNAYPCCLIRPFANLVVPVVPSEMRGCLEPVHRLEKSKSNKSKAEDKKAPVAKVKEVSNVAPIGGEQSYTKTHCTPDLEEGKRPSVSSRVDMTGECATASCSSQDSGQNSSEGGHGEGAATQSELASF